MKTIIAILMATIFALPATAQEFGEIVYPKDSRQEWKPNYSGREFKGTCPVCQKNHLVSTVIPDGPGWATVVSGTPFFDEKGIYHYHDPNVYEQSYICSRGHKFVVTTTHSCPFESDRSPLQNTAG